MHIVRHKNLLVFETKTKIDPALLQLNRFETSKKW